MTEGNCDTNSNLGRPRISPAFLGPTYLVHCMVRLTNTRKFRWSPKKKSGKSKADERRKKSRKQSQYKAEHLSDKKKLTGIIISIPFRLCRVFFATIWGNSSCGDALKICTSFCFLFRSKCAKTALFQVTMPPASVTKTHQP